MTRFLLRLVIFSVFVVPGFAAQDLSEPEKNCGHLWKTFDRNHALGRRKAHRLGVAITKLSSSSHAKHDRRRAVSIIPNMLGNLNDSQLQMEAKKIK